MPELPIENMLDPMPDGGGTLRSDPRLRTLFELLVVRLVDGSADGLDLPVREGPQLLAGDVPMGTRI